MAEALTGARSRSWATILALITGLSLLAIAIWPSDATASGDAAEAARFPDLLWLSHIVAGAAAVAAVPVAQRWQRRTAARAMLIGAAVLLLLVLFMFRDFGPRALLTLVLPAVAMAVAAVGIGPVPRD